MKITHRFVDNKIIEHLNKIGYSEFYEKTTEGDWEFLIDYTYKDIYNFETFVNISGTSITKDSEYHCENTDLEFKIIKICEKTLQDKFDEWLDGYNVWINEDE